MFPFAVTFSLFTALATASPVHSQPQLDPDLQNVLDLSHARPQTAGNPRTLRGRFLHITDIHPDPFYKHGTDPDGEHPCHAGNGTAGYFGAEKTECDSPFSLINATFDWIKHNIKDEIDFVVWTGDSARHDNDNEMYPRTNKQIEQLNRFVVDKFDQVFGKPDNRHDPDPTNDFVVPIVPTFGNNDVLPHNILEPGPNRWTRKYLSIWEKFVPQEQRHSFARGGWFFTEVIPNRLAVFSLNTLYFFNSNAAVDGCDASTEPGYEHFEWLRIQLEFIRQRRMKAILIGHIPPARTEAKQAWDESCYQKYTLWLRQYRDVVVGNIFGHMNVDHFILQDLRELTYKFQIPGIDDKGLRDGLSSISNMVANQAKSDYLVDLRQHWGNLPTPPRGSSYTSPEVEVQTHQNKKKNSKLEKFLKDIGGPYAERFSLSVVSPSLVPNFYPTLRIIEYNITGLENDHPALVPTASAYSDLTDVGSHIDLEEQEILDDFEGGSDLDDEYEISKKKKKHKKKKPKKQRPNFPLPSPPSASSPPGPGYSPQPLSLISWTQLYANLSKINKAVAEELQYRSDNAGIEKDNDLRMETMKKHFAFEVEYNTKNDSLYSMEDLTVRSWLDYAEKISRAKFTPKDVDPGSNHHTPISEPPTNLAIIEDEDDGEEGEYRIWIECLMSLFKKKIAALKVFNPYDDDQGSWSFLRKLKPELMLDQRSQQLDKSLFRSGPDKDKNSDDESKEDSGYDSDSDSEPEDEYSDTDSGYDDPENDNTSTTKHKKKKHSKHKRKRKGFNLKNNHLWHRFVRRAFVETKTWAELEDEFG